MNVAPKGYMRVAEFIGMMGRKIYGEDWTGWEGPLPFVPTTTEWQGESIDVLKIAAEAKAIDEGHERYKSTAEILLQDLADGEHDAAVLSETTGEVVGQVPFKFWFRKQAFADLMAGEVPIDCAKPLPGRGTSGTENPGRAVGHEPELGSLLIALPATTAVEEAVTSPDSSGRRAPQTATELADSEGYRSPFLMMMLEATLELGISEQPNGRLKKSEIVEYFLARPLPDGTRISANQAKSMATFVRPPDAMRGGNRRVG